MAVLPLADNNGYWQGNEYLQIYPRIEYIKAFSRTNTLGAYMDEGYYVLEPQDHEGISIYAKIEDWLAR